MKKNRYKLIGMIVSCMLIAGCTTGLNLEGPEVLRFSGSYCGVRAASEQVIQDKATWKKVWGQVSGTRSPQPALPKVDFTKQTVLAVFMGEKNTGGYSIRILTVKDAGKRIEVRVERSSPGPGTFTTQALTQPYDILVIPKPNKPITFLR